jgi:hypothetical protein
MTRRNSASAPSRTATASRRPEPGSPADVIRGLVLAVGGVSDAEAEMLLRILAQLRRIESEEGRAAAYEAARRVRSVWLEEEPTGPLVVH